MVAGHQPSPYSPRRSAFPARGPRRPPHRPFLLRISLRGSPPAAPRSPPTEPPPSPQPVDLVFELRAFRRERRFHRRGALVVLLALLQQASRERATAARGWGERDTKGKSAARGKRGGCPASSPRVGISSRGVPSGSGRARGIGTEVRARTHNPAMSMFAMPFFCLRNLPNTVSCSKDWLGVAIVASARPRPAVTASVRVGKKNTSNHARTGFPPGRNRARARESTNRRTSLRASPRIADDSFCLRPRARRALLRGERIDWLSIHMTGPRASSSTLFAPCSGVDAYVDARERREASPACV